MAPAPAPRSAGSPRGLTARVQALRSSDVGKASGLAIAMIVNNVVALLATVLFARVLDDYGSLAALLSFVLILSVVGQAMQVATAREAVLGTLGTGPVLAATLRSWTRTLLIATVVAAVIGVVLREPIADAVGVDETWAAAAGLPAGVLWLLLATLRGGLQGVGDYRTVGVSLIGEQCVRLVSGVALAAVGLDVTGAFLGTPISLGLLAVWCGLELRKRIRAGGAEAAAGTPQARAANAAALRPDGHLGPAVRLRDHIVNAWAPITGLIIIAMLQNIDVIGAKHRFSDDVASSYSATAVAAKVLIWVAMGAGFYLVPETSRRHSEGHDTRPVLARAIGIVLVCAVPVLLIFSAVPRLLLRLAFGADRLLAVDALLPLGIAFTLLAVTYLAIQYLLALRRTRFLIPLGIVALAEPVLLLAAAPKDPDGFSIVLLAIQAVAVAVALAIAFKRPRDLSPAPSPPAPLPSAAVESTPRG
jgi:O-antigen/teichoic acid export membrane protein